MIPVMVRKLMAKRMKGEKGFVGLTTLSEGGMQTGASHEGLNIAAVERVPLVVVVPNNRGLTLPLTARVRLCRPGRSRDRLRLRDTKLTGPA
jgi:pyruvate dehydrogenase E1 component alpha subunit/2-oxoisovalerate dehydrogenase E1 component alpha subunit